MIKHEDQIIHVWNKEELQVNSGPFELSIKFRIITEYVEPNFENIYPEELTRVLKPIVLKADYGEIYDITITAVSYTHLTLPTISCRCRSRWWPYH